MKKGWIHRGNNLVGVLCALFILVMAGWVFTSFKYTKEHCTLWGCDYELSSEEVTEEGVY
jgi:hypothetical protein